MTILPIVLIIIAVAGLVFVAHRAAQRRRIERERTRERVAGEADGHRHEVLANRAKADDVLAASAEREAAAADLRAQADRLQESAEELRARGERAHAAAGRHEERLTETEERLKRI